VKTNNLAAALLLAGAGLFAPALHSRTAQAMTYPTLRAKSKRKPTALSKEGVERIEKAQAKRDRKAAKLRRDAYSSTSGYHWKAQANEINRQCTQAAIA
jgi:hypothetical protein